MALVRLPLRPAIVSRPGTPVCRACSARAFSLTPIAGADEQPPRGSSPVPRRISLRQARDQSAAALAEIQKLQPKRTREPREPSSPKGTGRPNIGGLRFQPHKVSPRQSEQLAASPRFNIRRSPVNVPPQSGSARRDSPDGVEDGARQNRPASRQGALGPRRRTRRELLPDVEEEADHAEEEGELMADEALDITEEDLAASKAVMQKRTGVLAASHGVPSKSYMQRRAAVIAARMEKYRKDEERFASRARRDPRHGSRFGGDGSLRHATNRSSHSLRGRAWPYMLALQRSSTGRMERQPDKAKSKWDLLVQNWVLGNYSKMSEAPKGAAAQRSQASKALKAVVNRYIAANSTYDGQVGSKLMSRLDSISVAARL